MLILIAGNIDIFVENLSIIGAVKETCKDRRLIQPKGLSNGKKVALLITVAIVAVVLRAWWRNGAFPRTPDEWSSLHGWTSLLA